MDLWADPDTALALTALVLILLVECTEWQPPVRDFSAVVSLQTEGLLNLHIPAPPVLNMAALFSSTVNNFRLSCSPFPVNDEVAYWVKSRSTAWFSRFLLEQYDDSRWVAMFRMPKQSVFSLADFLKTDVEKKNTKYRLAVPVLIRVACTLFKLTHGANLTVCSEVFAIGRNTVCKILREVVHAINDNLKQEVCWPSRERIRRNQVRFEELCSLPGVVGAIDGVHVAIAKPSASPADYFHFKTGGYNMNCQVVVDTDKRFMDLYIGMPGSMNDSRMLRRSTLHYLASHGDLMNPAASVDGYSPYLLGDLGYPLLPWLMVPHHAARNLSVSQ